MISALNVLFSCGTDHSHICAYTKPSGVEQGDVTEAIGMLLHKYCNLL